MRAADGRLRRLRTRQQARGQRYRGSPRSGTLLLSSRRSPPARCAGRSGRAITPTPIGRCALRARGGDWVGVACAAGWRGSRARATEQLAAGRDLLLPLPLAVCADCGRARPCYWAQTDSRSARAAPLCAARECAWRAVSGASLTAASTGGMLCQTCDVKRGGTTGACQGCGQTAPLIKGLCVACRLRARVDQLAAGAARRSPATLAPFLRELAGSREPSSTLRWFYTPGLRSPVGCSRGEIPVSHQGLDEAALDAPNPVAFVRAKLVDSGVLDPAMNERPVRRVARHGGAADRGGKRSRARPRLRDLAGRASARADGATSRRGESVVDEVRTVAGDRGDQARALAP